MHPAVPKIYRGRYHIRRGIVHGWFTTLSVDSCRLVPSQWNCITSLLLCGVGSHTLSMAFWVWRSLSSSAWQQQCLLRWLISNWPSKITSGGGDPFSLLDQPEFSSSSMPHFIISVVPTCRVSFKLSNSFHQFLSLVTPFSWHSVQWLFLRLSNLCDIFMVVLKWTEFLVGLLLWSSIASCPPEPSWS